MFVLRLFYGYLAHPNGKQTQQQLSSFEFVTKNYATKRYKGAKAGGPVSALNQKYEKIADLRVRTDRFDAAEATLRNATRDVSGLIQFERRHGLSGQRTLHLAVGVAPAEFDKFIARLQAIGTLSYIQVQKHDRTNDFKQLEASRVALHETQQSLVALKSKGGSIKELVELENQILDLRRQIHNLGIKLGEFAEDSEF